MVVYRRPVARRQLLGALADLGVFVVEQPSGSQALEVAIAAGAEVAVVVANASPDDEQLVASLAANTARSVIVSLPAGADCAPFLGAGAMRCITDGDFETAFPALVAAAATRARTFREVAAAADAAIFGGIAFDPRIPALSRAGRSRTLSRSERAVLVRLWASAGRPVDALELERAADVPAGSRPGFLKAVILRLRRKIDDLGADPGLLRTVRGFGYVLATDRAREAGA
jgi:DNA-binding response OmpR family regulator